MKPPSFVLDASVVLTIEHPPAVLAAAFALPMRFVMPTRMLEKELGNRGANLLACGLSTEDMTPDELAAAQGIQVANEALSLPDIYAFLLATRFGIVLLTGDRPLRTYAEDKKVVVHGALWLLDEMDAECVASRDDLLECVSTAKARHRRLPPDEVQRRIDAWNVPRPSPP